MRAEEKRDIHTLMLQGCSANHIRQVIQPTLPNWRQRQMRQDLMKS